MIMSDTQVQEELATEESTSQESTPKEENITEKHNAEVQAEWEKEEQERQEKEIEEARADLEKLAPQTGAHRWVIGKGPEHGGNQNDYRVFVQEKLPWIPRGKFFALVSRTMSDAIKVSGGDIGGMADVF